MWIHSVIRSIRQRQVRLPGLPGFFSQGICPGALGSTHSWSEPPTPLAQPAPTSLDWRSKGQASVQGADLRWLRSRDGQPACVCLQTQSERKGSAGPRLRSGSQEGLPEMKPRNQVQIPKTDQGGPGQPQRRTLQGMVHGGSWGTEPHHLILDKQGTCSSLSLLI